MNVISHWHHFQAKGHHDGTLRSRIAWWCRRLADRIDGKDSLATEFLSGPCLDRSEHCQFLERGFQHTSTLFQERVAAKACEEAMRETMPHLFGSED